MTVEEAICARVESLTPVTTLVGSRVYLDKAEQGAPYPLVVVQLVDDIAGYHLRGPNGSSRARVQTDVYAQEASGVDPYDQASTLAEAIHGDGHGTSASGIHGWIGAVGSPAFEVLGCFRVDRTRGYEGEEMRVVRIRQDYYVEFRTS